MNIFRPEEDHSGCAAAINDQRLGTQLMELNQLVSTTILLKGGLDYHKYIHPTGLCKVSHPHHPLRRWCGESVDNSRWALAFARSVALEWFHRFGEHHGSSKRLNVIERLLEEIHDKKLIPSIPKTEQPNCAKHSGLGLDFSHLPLIPAYRAYLSTRWLSDKRKPKWTRGQPPVWRLSFDETKPRAPTDSTGDDYGGFADPYLVRV